MRTTDILRKEVTVVFGGGTPAVKGKVTEVYEEDFLLEGRPVGVSAGPLLHIIPWAGVAYVRVHAEPLDPVDQ